GFTDSSASRPCDQQILGRKDSYQKVVQVPLKSQYLYGKNCHKGDLICHRKSFPRNHFLTEISVLGPEIWKKSSRPLWVRSRIMPTSTSSIGGTKESVWRKGWSRTAPSRRPMAWECGLWQKLRPATPIRMTLPSRIWNWLPARLGTSRRTASLSCQSRWDSRRARLMISTRQRHPSPMSRWKRKFRCFTRLMSSRGGSTHGSRMSSHPSPASIKLCLSRLPKESLLAIFNRLPAST